jgi:hypothetical protein
VVKLVVTDVWSRELGKGEELTSISLSGFRDSEGSTSGSPGIGKSRNANHDALGAKPMVVPTVTRSGEHEPSAWLRRKNRRRTCGFGDRGSSSEPGESFRLQNQRSGPGGHAALRRDRGSASLILVSYACTGWVHFD